MTEKCQNFILFQKHLRLIKVPEKSTVILALSLNFEHFKSRAFCRNFEHFKANRAVYCNKSKCIQIQVHFHFLPTLNTIALRWLTCGSRATCNSLPSFMWLLR